MRTTEETSRTTRPEVCEADRIFLPDEVLQRVLQRTGTPVFLYDEKGLRDCAKSLTCDMLFSAQDVKVSDCPYPEILRILCAEGFGLICRTPEELHTAIACGCPGERIRYAGVCARPELVQILRRLGAELVLASPVVIPCALTDRVCLLCRLPGRSAYQLPASSRRPRVGLTAEEAIFAASMAMRRGASDLCIMACPDGNITAHGVLQHHATHLIRLAEQIRAESGVEIGRIHLGSGLGMAYNRFRDSVDAAAELDALLQTLREAPREFRVECSVSRRLIEPHAIFAASCLGVYERERQTVILDASFRQLSVPQLDRYRHISVLGKNTVSGRRATDVLGTDLLSKDWFADSRLLPGVEEGDVLILHDVGCCSTASAECCMVTGDGALCRLTRDSDCSGEFPDARSDPCTPSPASE